MTMESSKDQNIKSVVLAIVSVLLLMWTNTGFSGASVDIHGYKIGLEGFSCALEAPLSEDIWICDEMLYNETGFNCHLEGNILFIERKMPTYLSRKEEGITARYSKSKHQKNIGFEVPENVTALTKYGDYQSVDQHNVQAVVFQVGYFETNALLERYDAESIEDLVEDGLFELRDNSFVINHASTMCKLEKVLSLRFTLDSYRPNLNELTNEIIDNNSLMGSDSIINITLY